MAINLVSCSDSSGPTITHLVVKSDAKGLILDSKDRNLLDTFQQVFYARDEYPEGDPNFKYLLDITTAEKTIRWQYNEDGKIRSLEKGNTEIFKLKDPLKLNRLLKL
jgi:hypothetical protein